MFLSKSDITGSGIHAEILDMLSRNSPETVEDINLIAIDEAAGYLSSRYDVDTIFAQTGSSRNDALLSKCIDISLYHIHCKGNPNVLPDIRVKRYDDAIDWLKGVQKGVINPVGLPLLTNDDGEAGSLIYGSNPKRVNHY